MDDLFGSRAHVRVLRVLSELPKGMPLSGREVARRAGLSHTQATAVLASLAEQGITRRRTRARLNLYELNTKHEVVPRLKQFYRWERGLFSSVISFLRGRLSQSEDILGAALFGSAAWGDMEPSSDIDLAVLARPTAEDDVSDLLEDVGEEVRDRFGNRLAPLVASSRSDGRWPRDPPIWRRIAREGIVVIGSLPGGNVGQEA